MSCQRYETTSLTPYRKLIEEINQATKLQLK